MDHEKVNELILVISLKKKETREWNRKTCEQEAVVDQEVTMVMVAKEVTSGMLTSLLVIWS